MSDNARERIDRAIREGEDVLTGKLGESPDEEAWSTLAEQVVGDLADDYEAAVAALREIAARPAVRPLKEGSSTEPLTEGPLDQGGER